MDFLTLLLLYLALFGFASLLCLWPGRNLSHNTYVSWLLHKLTKVVGALLPVDVRKFLLFLFSYAFYQRNHLFQGLYITLVALGHWFLLFDTIPFLYAENMDKNHVFAPMLHLVINAILFVVCCYSDPGIINNENQSKYANVYSYDGVMYKHGTTCPTCNIAKPARSKHCAFTDRCIHHFDHFCPWTNNAVGGLNHRYFVALLISITLMAGNASCMVYQALHSITQSAQLWSAQYVDKRGVPQPMNLRVLTQTLFMKFPTVVFLGAALTVISLMVGGFTLYHIWLVVSGQTTNERYKKHRLYNQQGIKIQNLYYNGVLMNIYEEVFPTYFIERCKQRPDLRPSLNNKIKNGSLKAKSNVEQRKKRR